MKNTDKSRKTFWEYLKTACCIFTPSVILIYTVSSLIPSDHKVIPTVGTVLGLFAMSFIISVTTSFYSTMSFTAAHAVNFLVLGAAYYLMVIAMRGLAGDGIQTLIAMTVYTVIFAAVTIAVIIIRGRKKELINDVKKYESRFN